MTSPSCDAIHAGVGMGKSSKTEAPSINAIDVDASISKKKAKERIAELQLELLKLQTQLRDDQDHAVVVVFQGVDAAGKGGAIRRLTGRLDPRGYDVFPIGPPEPFEQRQHYLWRFQTRMPSRGEIAIFDRSWYGRVLVERIEGYCTEDEWRRAYDQINDFERAYVAERTPVIKFWLHVSKDEQLNRFREREKDPFKKYKITEDDWRNREKWDQYIEAADEMFARTHTEHAPWHLIGGNDKWHARVRVLETVIKAMNQTRGGA